MEPKKYLFDWSFSLENYDDADEFVIEQMLEIIIDEIYDELKKKKTVALFLPTETVNKYKPSKLTKYELGLI